MDAQERRFSSLLNSNLYAVVFAIYKNAYPTALQIGEKTVKIMAYPDIYVVLKTAC